MKLGFEECIGVCQMGPITAKVQMCENARGIQVTGVSGVKKICGEKLEMRQELDLEHLCAE